MICLYDEAFTTNEMLEETNRCKSCTLDCINTRQNRIIEVEPVKHGCVITKNHNNSEIYFCSNCGDELPFDGDSIIDVNYCPRCGAKIERW